MKIRGEITGTTPVAKATVVPRDAAYCVSVCVAVRVCLCVYALSICVCTFKFTTDSLTSVNSCMSLCGPKGPGGGPGDALEDPSPLRRTAR